MFFCGGVFMVEVIGNMWEYARAVLASTAKVFNANCPNCLSAKYPVMFFAQAPTALASHWFAAVATVATKSVLEGDIHISPSAGADIVRVAQPL